MLPTFSKWCAATALIFSVGVHAADLKFSFGSEPQPGYTQVTQQTAFDEKAGFGFTEIAPAPGQPSVFAVNTEEGNYDVTIRFGDSSRATSTTIKAESRRLMVEKVETAPGEFKSVTFTVNVKKPAIGSGGSVSLADREKGPPLIANWDEQLSFEFNGKQPGVASLEIKPATDALTVFLAGDSTVTDQSREPWAGWGQMLPRFFQPGVAVSNHSWSGLALYSFERQKRLAKVFSMMKKGDYLFIQFGHNDQKDKSEGAGPFSTYKSNLKKYVQSTREKGGIPILVTPMERRRWKDDKPQATLNEYAEAVRQVGSEDKVQVIDLNAMSLKLYGALGVENSKRLFVHYPANTFPGQGEALKDDTHHNNFGGYELARCIVEGIKSEVPELAKRLAKDAGTFDPAKPDAPDQFALPPSPSTTRPVEKPAGS